MLTNKTIVHLRHAYLTICEILLSNPSRQSTYQDSLRQHGKILVSKFWTDEDELANQFYGRFPDRCRLIQQSSVHSTLHISLKIHDPYSQFVIILQYAFEPKPISSSMIVDDTTTICVFYDCWWHNHNMRLLWLLMTQPQYASSMIVDDTTTICVFYDCWWHNHNMLLLWLLMFIEQKLYEMLMNYILILYFLI